MVPQTIQQPKDPQAVTGKAVPVTTKNPQPVAQPGVTAAAVEGVLPEKEKKSIFKKWWFWLIVVLVLIGLGVGGWLLLR